ncbi:MAG: hypothetical protein KH290_04305 [Roseburia sp.]|nr:hypothetical protein [Roseburia sp.]
MHSSAANKTAMLYSTWFSTHSVSHITTVL